MKRKRAKNSSEKTGKIATLNKRGKITLILVVKATISKAITVAAQLLVDSSTLTFARMLARMNLGRAFIFAFIVSNFEAESFHCFRMYWSHV